MSGSPQSPQSAAAASGAVAAAGGPGRGGGAAASRLRELGGLASWNVTSAKPGNGVELLRDGSADTFWQSDGAQPHLVNVQFSRRMEIAEVHLYLDFKSDESYTPSRLAIRAGSTHHDLRDVCIVELKEPCGWIAVPLGEGAPGGRLRAFLVQVAVLANHQNGRDTHIRQILVFGPASGGGSQVVGCSAGGAGSHAGAGAFTSPEFAAFGAVR